VGGLSFIFVEGIIPTAWAYSQLGYHFLDIGIKDFVFAIFQIYNLNGKNLSERY
jgi:hypothetical protein